MFGENGMQTDFEMFIKGRRTIYFISLKDLYINVITNV